MCLPVEPFKVESEFEHAGLKCAVVIAREASNRCGYVRVPPGHPLHGLHYEAPDVQVHGGLTFSEAEPCVEADGVGWWFGFDCAHHGDSLYDPEAKIEEMTTVEGRETLRVHRQVREETLERWKGINAAAVVEVLTLYRMTDHYWSQAEVEAETRQLAEQLAAVTA